MLWTEVLWIDRVTYAASPRERRRNASLPRSLRILRVTFSYKLSVKC